jgi:hypothetical protein
MPSEAVDGYRYPSHGTGRLHRDGQPLPGEDENYIECMYFIQWDQEFVSFQDQGWTDFRAAANVGDEALLVMKVERMQGYIGLNFVEIINPAANPDANQDANPDENPDANQDANPDANPDENPAVNPDAAPAV